MEDLAEAIHRIAQESRFQCPIQQNVVYNMELFNKYKECPCCEEHSRRKPINLADTRRGQRFPDGDSRNYTGTHEDVAEGERIDTMAERHPRVFTFTHSQRCACPCRHLMRRIAVDVRANVTADF